MKVIVEVDRTDYERYVKGVDNDECELTYSGRMIAQGVPLPAEHGNLVDINDVATVLIYSGICDSAKCGEVKDVLSKIPIIVEGSTE